MTQKQLPSTMLSACKSKLFVRPLISFHKPRPTRSSNNFGSRLKVPFRILTTVEFKSRLANYGEADPVSEGLSSENVTPKNKKEKEKSRSKANLIDVETQDLMQKKQNPQKSQEDANAIDDITLESPKESQAKKSQKKTKASKISSSKASNDEVTTVTRSEPIKSSKKKVAISSTSSKKKKPIAPAVSKARKLVIKRSESSSGASIVAKLQRLSCKADLPVDWPKLLVNILENAQVSDGPEETVSKVLISALNASPKNKGSQVIWDLDESETETMDAKNLSLIPVHNEKIDVPRLSYGLDRVLFNQGVYQLQDPRTRVFNFDPYLREIMPVNEFDFGALSQYITSSRDRNLLEKAAANQKKYVGSTSSMSSTLSHFHFLLSNWRPIEYGNLSGTIPKKLKICNYTLFTRAPTAIFLRYRDGAYAIDADKEFDDSNILAMLGKSMEKLLTLPTEKFEKYRRENSDQLTEGERNERESYHYTTFGDFLLRSQLDAYDPRLPGTGMFDLKTRCVVSVRMDVSEYENTKGYEIRKTKGEWESYEREYYDMIRAAFLKYSMQVRMGRMDGIFVAFHNTSRIFGFQYISLEEMDYALHGTEDLTIGNEEFKLSLCLLNTIFDRVTARYPNKTVRFFFETPSQKSEKIEGQGELTHMNIIAQPLDEEDVELIQAQANERIKKFERDILGIGTTDSSLGYREKKEIQSSIDQEIAKNLTDGEVVDEDAAPDENFGIGSKQIISDEGSYGSTYDFTSKSMDKMSEEKLFTTELQSNPVDESINENNIDEPTGKDKSPNPVDVINQDSITQDDKKNDFYSSQETAPQAEIMREKISEYGHIQIKEDDNQVKLSSSENQSQSQSLPDDLTQKDEWYSKPFMAMKLTVRSKVNGSYVTRPENLTKYDNWTIEYQLAEYPDGKPSVKIYHELKQRRKAVHMRGLDMDPSKPANSILVRELRKYIEKGKRFRERENEIESKLPKYIVGEEMVGQFDTNTTARSNQK